MRGSSQQREPSLGDIVGTVVGLVLMLVLLAWLFGAFDSGSGSSITDMDGNPITGDNIQAYNACVQAIRAKLLDPSSADFSSFTESPPQRHQDGKYFVAVHVHAANVFGGKLPAEFACIVDDTTFSATAIRTDD